MIELKTIFVDASLFSSKTGENAPLNFQNIKLLKFFQYIKPYLKKKLDQ